MGSLMVEVINAPLGQTTAIFDCIELFLFFFEALTIPIGKVVDARLFATKAE
jgi:hypothetical protein